MNGKSVSSKQISAKSLAAKPLAAKAVAVKSVAVKSLAVKPIAAKPVAIKPVAVKAVAAKLEAAKPEAVAPKQIIKESRVSSLEFKVGDKVVYPAHGVGVVDSIQMRKVSNTEQKFYMISILETGMKIMVPVSQVRTVGLRKVVDEKTVEQVYTILKDRNITVDTQTWNRRYRDYSQKIKTGSVLEIAKVIRDLSALKGDKELSFGERRMLDTAQGLLVKEISIAKARSEDVIRNELEHICEA